MSDSISLKPQDVKYLSNLVSRCSKHCSHEDLDDLFEQTWLQPHLPKAPSPSSGQDWILPYHELPFKAQLKCLNYVGLRTADRASVLEEQLAAANAKNAKLESALKTANAKTADLESKLKNAKAKNSALDAKYKKRKREVFNFLRRRTRTLFARCGEHRFVVDPNDEKVLVAYFGGRDVEIKRSHFSKVLRAVDGKDGTDVSDEMLNEIFTIAREFGIRIENKIRSKNVMPLSKALSNIKKAISKTRMYQENALVHMRYVGILMIYMELCLPGHWVFSEREPAVATETAGGLRTSGLMIKSTGKYNQEQFEEKLISFFGDEELE